MTGRVDWYVIEFWGGYTTATNYFYKDSRAREYIKCYCKYDLICTTGRDNTVKRFQLGIF